MAGVKYDPDRHTFAGDIWYCPVCGHAILVMTKGSKLIQPGSANCSAPLVKLTPSKQAA